MSAIVVLGGLALAWTYFNAQLVSPWHDAGDRAGKELAIQHYSKEVRQAANKYNLDYSYLMALIMLECGGKRPAGTRFEPHVFNRLKQVRNGTRKNYENVTARHLSLIHI